jgi:hypothetical protein
MQIRSVVIWLRRVRSAASIPVVAAQLATTVAVTSSGTVVTISEPVNFSALSTDPTSIIQVGACQSQYRIDKTVDAYRRVAKRALTARRSPRRTWRDHVGRRVGEDLRRDEATRRSAPSRSPFTSRMAVTACGMCFITSARPTAAVRWSNFLRR